jgi:hypothetical protein
MTRTLHRLSATEVRNAKAAGYIADGGNLYLRVALGAKANGKAPAISKGWIFRYAIGGRTRDAGLGGYPTISLAKAREEAERLRRLVAAGVDPIEARKEERQAAVVEAAKAITFEECAKAFIASHEAGWRNEKHRQQWANTLATYAYPVCGALPVGAVDTILVMKVLEPIWAAKPETAGRVRGRIERILDWAKVRGYRDGENPARLRGHLDTLLPKKSKVHRVRHHAALPYRDVGTFMAKLRDETSISARALASRAFPYSFERTRLLARAFHAFGGRALSWPSRRGPPPRTRGRPKGTGKIDRFELYKDVEIIRRTQTDADIAKACRILAKDRKSRWRGHPAESLEARYYEQLRVFEAGVPDSPMISFLRRAAARICKNS